ncbi:MAG: hypothetical protein NC548_42575 [Lachnospiraceae bacterium]|nr:hypothetical protein [Lachnospiraceae bacterium]
MMVGLKKIFNEVWEWTCSPFKKMYRNIRGFYHNFVRSSKWFARMWNNFDWDHYYLILMIVDKMKDMRYQLDVVDGEYVDLRHQPASMDADESDTVDRLAGLDKAIEIGERLLKDDYLEYTPNVQKWFDEHGYCYTGENKMSDKLHDEWFNCHKKSEKKRKKDINDFFNTIKKEHTMWWS